MEVIFTGVEVCVATGVSNETWTFDATFNEVGIIFGGDVVDVYSKI